MCWTVVKESLLLRSPNIASGYQAACCTVHSTYWSVINHSHVLYLFMWLWHLEHSLHEWVTEASSFDWISVVCCLYPSISFSRGRPSHLWLTPPTHFIHYPHPSLSDSPYLALTLCQIQCSPRFPTEAGSRRACPAAAPVLPWDWLTPLLSSQVIQRHTSTHSHASMIYHIKQGLNCAWMQAHTDSPFCLCLKNWGSARESEKEWC